MTLTHFAIIAVCAYLLGSLSFAIIVSKLTLGKDIRNYGSGNAGLTNAYRTMGAKKTLLVLLGDIAKGAAAMSPTGFDWLGLILVAIVLPAILAPLINMVCRRLGCIYICDSSFLRHGNYTITSYLRTIF